MTVINPHFTQKLCTHNYGKYSRPKLNQTMIQVYNLQLGLDFLFQIGLANLEARLRSLNLSL